jgi:ribosomal protein S18 acetylase RimI-like enzyme
MIQKLDLAEIGIAEKIHRVFQVSYTVEARLLGVTDFPPLNRKMKDLMESPTLFYGCWEDSNLVGVIEIEMLDPYIDIWSLVVDPQYFRRGFAQKLLEYVEAIYWDKNLVVETGWANQPALSLYQKLGFKIIDRWQTSIGIEKIRLEKVR